MNYHIIKQDKFFNGYIEDIYDLHLEDDNVFWVQGNPGECPLLTSSRTKEYLTNDKEHIINRLRTLSPNDKLFVSWYCGTIAEAIIESGIKNPLYVYLMGGEFYADPWGWHNHWLYDKMTYQQLKKVGYEPSIKWTRRNPLHWGRIIDDIKHLNSWKKQRPLDYQRKLKQVERIDYIVLPKEAEGEFSLVKKLYPTFRAKHVYGLFDQNFDLASVMPTKQDASKPYRVLLGNSADPTNNHIDGMHFLKKNFIEKFDLYSVLSYGDTNGKKWAVECGQKLFGDHFYAVEDYMDRQSYLNFVNSMDVVMMYHNRQQAAGNIMTALVLGKPVFMKSTNVVYQTLKNLGLPSVYDVNLLKEKPLHFYIEEAQSKRQETIELIRNVYSKELRLKYLRDLLTE